MRNKYTKEFENFVRKNISKYTKEEFIQLTQDKFGIKLSTGGLRRYLNRHHIENKYVDYKQCNSRNVLSCPIGTERITNEGVFVKVRQPDVWRRKTRVMYEKYYKCKLKENDYIIFLNRNRNDFRKENLVKLSKKEVSYLCNNKMYCEKPQLTELGILTAKLMIKANEKEIGNE